MVRKKKGREDRTCPGVRVAPRNRRRGRELGTRPAPPLRTAAGSRRWHARRKTRYMQMTEPPASGAGKHKNTHTHVHCDRPRDWPPSTPGQRQQLRLVQDKVIATATTAPHARHRVRARKPALELRRVGEEQQVLMSRRDQVAVPEAQWRREAHGVLGVGGPHHLPCFQLHLDRLARLMAGARDGAPRQLRLTGVRGEHVCHAAQIPESIAVKSGALRLRRQRAADYLHFLATVSR
eukprot:COSAG01_NODE_7555_length_3164_cov_15.727392_4_plen_236_part_00